MKLAVIIPAAGASRRFGGKPKIDEDLGGRPVLQRTVELFVNRPEVATVVVAGPAASFDEFRLRHGDRLALLGVHICKGGETYRYESVRNALAFLRASAADAFDVCSHVAVHDAARPAASGELIDRILAAAARHNAVIPAIDVPDALKRVSAAATEDKSIDPLDAILGGAGKPKTAFRTVEASVSRDNLVCVQTPQVFAKDLIIRAYEQKNLASADDAELVERLGEPVAVVEGDHRNIKITRPGDVDLVRRILNLRPPAEREAHKKF